MKFLSDIEVEEGLRDKDGGLGADGQVLSSTGSLTSWTDAGTIGGSIADNQIAVGASTANNIEGSDDFRLVPLTLGSVSAGSLVLQGRLVMSDKLVEGAANLFIGKDAGGTTWSGINIGIGGQALRVSTGGELNCALGYSALRNSTLGDENTALGHNSLYYLAGSGQDYNTAIGTNAARYYSTGTSQLTQSSQGVYIGNDTRASANNISNEIAIGYGAVGGGSDTITLGNSSVDLLRIPGLGSTNGHVLTYSTTDGGIVLAAGGGGGGGIGGSTTATEIAFGSSTASEIDSDPGLTYTTQNGLSVKNTSGNGSSFITMRKGTAGNCVFEMQGENTPGSYSAKFFVDLTSTENTEITATGNLTLQNKVGTTKDIILNPTANVGIGNTSPDEKLDVTGRIKASNGVQVGVETNNSPTIADVGTFRYKELNGTNPTPKSNYSYVDMVMRTGASSYAWVNIVTNNW